MIDSCFSPIKETLGSYQILPKHISDYKKQILAISTIASLAIGITLITLSVMHHLKMMECYSSDFRYFGHPFNFNEFVGWQVALEVGTLFVGIALGCATTFINNLFNNKEFIEKFRKIQIFFLSLIALASFALYVYVYYLFTTGSSRGNFSSFHLQMEMGALGMLWIAIGSLCVVILSHFHANKNSITTHPPNEPHKLSKEHLQRAKRDSHL